MLAGQLAGPASFGAFGAETPPKKGAVLFHIGKTPVTQMQAAIGVGALALVLWLYKSKKLGM